MKHGLPGLPKDVFLDPAKTAHQDKECAAANQSCIPRYRRKP